MHMVKLGNYWVINGKPGYLVGINYQTAEYGHFTDHWEDEAASSKPEVDCDSPNVEVGLFQGEKKTLVFAVNHERFPVDAQLQFWCKPMSAKDFESGHSQRVGDNGQVDPVRYGQLSKISNLARGLSNGVDLHLERNGVKIFEVMYL